MDRRQFLRGGVGAALAVPFLRDLAAGQGQSGQPARPPAGAEPVTRKLILDANSRALQWLRSADDVAEAAIEMVCGGVCVTVQPYPGHVDPAKVAQELPAFVARVRGHGLR